MDADLLEKRRGGLGSSDAAAACGLSPWQTPAGLYYDKLGVDMGRQSPELEWGTRLEPVIAQAFTDRTGLALEIPEPMIRHPTIPWMFANLDRRALGTIIVELKAAFHREGWGEDGTDQIPEHYIVQVQHQLAVTGHRSAFVAALLCGCDFRVYPIHRNEALIAWIIQRETEFWDRVQRRDPPALDCGHSSTLGMLSHLYGYEARERLLLPHEMEYLATEYLAAGERMAAARISKDFAKAKLLEAMGSAAEAVLPNGTTLRRRQVRRAGYEVKPTEFTTFTVKPVTTGEPQ